MIKKTACIILILMLSLLTGCWNNREITELGIVAGIGIDKASDGKIEVTVQIIGASKSGGSQSGSSPSGGSSIDISAEGITVFDAARNLIPKLSQKAYYSQLQVMLISEEVAKDGLDKTWDFFERDHEVNRLFRVLVVKNGTAKSVLEASSDVEQIGAVEIANTIDNDAFGKSVKLQAFKVSEKLSNPLTGIVTGTIDTEGAQSLKDMKVQGGAVFNKAKFVGYLDNEQTRGYLFAKDQIHSTILAIANPKQKGQLVSVEVIGSKGKLTSDVKDGKPKFGIEITAYGNIADEQGSADLTNDKEVKVLEGECESLISGNIKSMMNVSQKVYDSDILDFNDLVYKYHYSDFKKMKLKWDEVYKNAEVEIKVQFTIKRPGIVRKPAYTDSDSR